MPKWSALRNSAALFAALGDETRLGLVRSLSSHGPQSIARMTAASTVTRQAVTKHLRVLSQAGLVRGVRRGRERIWTVDAARLREAGTYLGEISRQWDSALDRLKTYVEK